MVINTWFKGRALIFLSRTFCLAAICVIILSNNTVFAQQFSLAQLESMLFSSDRLIRSMNQEDNSLFSHLANMGYTYQTTTGVIGSGKYDRPTDDPLREPIWRLEDGSIYRQSEIPSNVLGGLTVLEFANKYFEPGVNPINQQLAAGYNFVDGTLTYLTRNFFERWKYAERYTPSSETAITFYTYEQKRKIDYLTFGDTELEYSLRVYYVQRPDFNSISLQIERRCIHDRSDSNSYRLVRYYTCPNYSAEVETNLSGDNGDEIILKAFETRKPNIGWNY